MHRRQCFEEFFTGKLNVRRVEHLNLLFSPSVTVGNVGAVEGEEARLV